MPSARQRKKSFSACASHMIMESISFFKDFIDSFLERGLREGEREEEKHQCVDASHEPPTKYWSLISKYE